MVNKVDKLRYPQRPYALAHTFAFSFAYQVNTFIDAWGHTITVNVTIGRRIQVLQSCGEYYD